MQNVLLKMCTAWRERWDDEHVGPACWVKRILPDTSSPGNTSLFQLPFGGKPRTTLGNLVPYVNDIKLRGDPNELVEQCKQVLREMRKPQGERTQRGSK